MIFTNYFIFFIFYIFYFIFIITNYFIFNFYFLILFLLLFFFYYYFLFLFFIIFNNFFFNSKKPFILFSSLKDFDGPLSEEREESNSESSDEIGDILSKENHVAFIPEDILETVIEAKEFRVTPVKFFYILFRDQSTFFQDFLLKIGASEMHTSKWGNRDNEIGSWRQLDYVWFDQFSFFIFVFK